MNDTPYVLHARCTWVRTFYETQLDQLILESVILLILLKYTGLTRPIIRPDDLLDWACT